MVSNLSRDLNSTKAIQKPKSSPAVLPRWPLGFRVSRLVLRFQGDGGVFCPQPDRETLGVVGDGSPSHVTGHLLGGQQTTLGTLQNLWRRKVLVTQTFSLVCK